MTERLSVRDFIQAALLCVALCLALLAIKFEAFGGVGAGACILLLPALFCTGQSRPRWQLILPALALGGLGYSAASTTVIATFL